MTLVGRKNDGIDQHIFLMFVWFEFDLSIFYGVIYTRGLGTSSYNWHVPVLIIIHTIYTVVILILHVTYS